MFTHLARSSSSATVRHSRQRWELPRLTPLASAITLLAIAGSLTGTDALAQSRPFGSGWMAAKGAVQGHIANAGTLPNGMLAGVNSAARQQQQARQRLNRSVANLGRTAAAIAAQQAAQNAARVAAHDVASNVPDGYTAGGLWDKDAAGNELAWTGADRPVTTHGTGGKQTVNIKQTADKAILNWDTFNVGRNTTVAFEQKATDSVLNKVVGAAAPSQIQGAIKGAGTVMVVNQNGVMFSGTSQVNVRNLVAAATGLSDEQFLANGIYSTQTNGVYAPSFTDAGGKLVVDAGAQITTHTPASATQGGGYVLLLGGEVRNAGTITTPQGQAALAAGDNFILRRGQGTDGNPLSTTRGNEVIGVEPCRQQRSGRQRGSHRGTHGRHYPDGQYRPAKRRALVDDFGQCPGHDPYPHRHPRGRGGTRAGRRLVRAAKHQRDRARPQRRDRARCAA